MRLLPLLASLSACAPVPPAAPSDVPASQLEAAPAATKVPAAPAAPRVSFIITKERKASPDYPAGNWVDVEGNGPGVDQLRQALTFESVWGGDYEPFPEAAEFDRTYADIKYESPEFASLDLAIEACAAYCSVSHHYFNVDRMQATSTGLRDCLDEDGMTRLLERVTLNANASFDAEERRWQQLAQAPNQDAALAQEAYEMLVETRREIGDLVAGDLEQWYVEDGKLVFVLYRMEYPHVAQAIGPDTHITVSTAEFLELEPSACVLRQALAGR